LIQQLYILKLKHINLKQRVNVQAILSTFLALLYGCEEPEMVNAKDMAAFIQYIKPMKSLIASMTIIVLY